MFSNFFIWCAGSDKSVLSKCSDAERTKHIGFGTLVLIPAILALVSMTYALSTIDKINEKPIIYFAGGFAWCLIILAFDRFIVSTHRRKNNNWDEFKNINLYLRLLFALPLGVISSHPIVLLYFQGSITQEIKSEITDNIAKEDSIFRSSSDTLRIRLNELIDHKYCLERLLTAEQSGHKVTLDCGYSSGIPNIRGSFTRTLEIKRLIKSDSISIENERTRVNTRIEEVNRVKIEKQDNYRNNTSFDYLNRELTLTKLKKKNSIIVFTQWFLMIVFILLDISAVTFKTFAPFGMYDKILTDDIDLLKNIDTSSRQLVLQNAYNDISSVYADAKNINKQPEQYKKLFNQISSKYHFQRDVLIGFVIGFILFLIILFYINANLSKREIITFGVITSLAFSIFSNAIYDLIKFIFKADGNG